MSEVLASILTCASASLCAAQQLELQPGLLLVSPLEVLSSVLAMVFEMKAAVTSAALLLAAPIEVQPSRSLPVRRISPLYLFQ